MDEAAIEEDPLIGQHVWIKVDDDDEWALARVEQHWNGQMRLQRTRAPRGAAGEKGVDLKVTVSEAEFAKLTPATSDITEARSAGDLVSDLVELEDVAEYTMLHTLRGRYNEDAIYTAIGPVLVGINPYKPVANCAPDALALLGKRDPDDMPPHIFTLASQAPMV